MTLARYVTCAWNDTTCTDSRGSSRGACLSSATRGAADESDRRDAAAGSAAGAADLAGSPGSGSKSGTVGDVAAPKGRGRDSAERVDGSR